jgi:hypothetical protein
MKKNIEKSDARKKVRREKKFQTREKKLDARKKVRREKKFQTREKKLDARKKVRREKKVEKYEIQAQYFDGTNTAPYRIVLWVKCSRVLDPGSVQTSGKTRWRSLEM